jgi:hypothetical protein
LRFLRDESDSPEKIDPTGLADGSTVQPQWIPIESVALFSDAPKGHNIIAQGSALGSPADKNQALKGRNRSAQWRGLPSIAECRKRQ